MEPGYILDDSILTMADYQKWMTRGHEAKEPTPRDLAEQRLRVRRDNPALQPDCEQAYGVCAGR